MRNNLAYYLWVILTAVVLIGCSIGADSKNDEIQTDISYSDVDVHYLNDDTLNWELNLPRQISGINNIHRTPNLANRTTNWHKSNFEFIKSGKVVNASVFNLVLKGSLNYHCRFAKSASWLICLGKLII